MVNENQFFRQATLRLFSSLEIETALRRLLDYMKRHFPADGIVLGFYDPDTNTSKLSAGIYPDRVSQPPGIISMPEQLREWLKEQWEQEQGVRVINDLDQEDPALKKIFSMVGAEDDSFLDMGLTVEGTRLGGVVVSAKGKNRYNSDHGKLFSLLQDPLMAAMDNVLKHQEIKRLQKLLEDDNRYLTRRLIQMTGDAIIGADFGLANVMKQVRQVAPMNSPVLLMGETGTGKEVIANAIHNASNRKDSPLIKVNCGAIPESLIDSELFGHEKGSFTGAINTKRGLFERAHTGTIFLDEVGELPLAAQVRLLRVLQEKQIERVGGTRTISVDVRVISATHRNLASMVGTGKFREDLWFRLNVFPIIIPPLRQRPEDIPALVNYFIDKKARELNIRNPVQLNQHQINQIQKQEWPGNVRELENTIERHLITGQVSVSSVRIKPDVTENGNQGQTEKITFDEAMKNYMETVLQNTGGKVEGNDGAAAWLGLHPSTLRAKMKKLNIAFGRGRKL